MPGHRHFFKSRFCNLSLPRLQWCSLKVASGRSQVAIDIPWISLDKVWDLLPSLLKSLCYLPVTPLWYLNIIVPNSVLSNSLIISQVKVSYSVYCFPWLSSYPKLSHSIHLPYSYSHSPWGNSGSHIQRVVTYKCSFKSWPKQKCFGGLHNLPIRLSVPLLLIPASSQRVNPTSVPF